MENGEEQLGVEEWLKRFDTYDSSANEEGGPLQARTNEQRSAWKAELLGVSRECLEDSLPHLDVGNTLSYTGQTSDSSEEKEGVSLDEKGQELLDVVSGRKVMRGEGYGPWSSRYAGHQFGSWAGQLGDGRAISIRTFHRSWYDLSWSSQLILSSWL